MAKPPKNRLHDDNEPIQTPASPDAPLGERTNAGPRPLSPQQKARQDGGRRGVSHEHHEHYNAGVQNVRVFDVPSAPAKPRRYQNTAKMQNRKGGAVVKAVRDADTTHLRRTHSVPNSARINKRRTNYPRLFLGWATAALVAEIAAALLWSPRLWVKSVQVEGNATVPTSHLLARLHIGPRDNWVRLSPAHLQTALEAEPSVEWAEVRRVLPPGVRVFVRERTPWASVQLGGVYYTIDRNLIPFRKNQTPESGLPRLVLSGTEAANLQNAAFVLGKPMTAPGLSDVSRCLAWSANQPDFPLESVEIDPQGKLCLNKVGGLPVRLGVGVDLDKKLQTLTLLLATRPELKENPPAEINLFAYDAPAVSWRVASAGSPVADPVADPISSVPLEATPGAEIIP